MPADFLLPLFAATLLANALLVAFAIRGLRRGSSEPDRSRGPGPRSAAMAPVGPATDQPMTDVLAHAIASRRAIDGEGPPTDEGLSSTAAVAPRSTATPTPEPAPEPALAPEPAAVRAPEPALAPVGGRRTRRKFALPPLDDDHERVSRSIETFLGGAEPTASETVAGAAAGPGAQLATAATTVALIAVDGLPRARRGRAAQAGIEDDATASALAMVERTIRGAARGTDIVSVTARGRYRIVLAGTGEVAARAYLRRIRATVEPLLESADRPLRLAVATATVLDEPIGDGIRRAGTRLAAARAALDAERGDAPAGAPEPAEVEIDRLDPEPRAAPD